MPLLPILRKSPFARLIFLFAAGIAIADCFRNFSRSVTVPAFLVIFLWLILLGVVKCYRSYNTGWVAGMVASLIIFLCGLWAADVDHRQEKKAASWPETPFLYHVMIIDPAESAGHDMKATARILAVRRDESWIKQNIRVLLYIRYDTAVRMIGPGSELLIHTGFKNIPLPANPGEFNYQKYLSIRHIYKQAFIRSGSWQMYGTSIRKTPRVMACMMRNKLLHSFERMNLEPAYFGLVSALTLGYKEDVDARTKQIFTRAGVMHIMALSGFNVGIIALVLGFMLGIFDKHQSGRLGKTITIILFLWLFALVTGLSPSVTRATVMISFVMTGRLFHKQVNTYNILFVSAFLLLTFSPGMLYDVSFQLSFAAVGGILVYQPFMNKMFVFKNFVVNKTWQLFTLSCAAQLATFPLALFYFHQFPVYFWLTNLYVVPLVSIIICVAGVYLAMAWLKPLALLVGKVLAILLKTLYLSVAIVEKLPFSMINGVYINGTQAALLMMIIFLLALIILFRMVKWFPVLFLLMLTFELIRSVQIRERTIQQLGLISGIRGETAMNFIHSQKAVLLYAGDQSPDERYLMYAFGSFWIKHGVNPAYCSLDSLDNNLCQGRTIRGLYCRPSWRGRNILISYNDQRLVLLRDENFYKFRSIKPLQADAVIVTGNLSVNTRRIIKEVCCGVLIIDVSVNKFHAEKWKRECEKAGLAYYVISEKGAYPIGKSVSGH